MPLVRRLFLGLATILMLGLGLMAAFGLTLVGMVMILFARRPAPPVQTASSAEADVIEGTFVRLEEPMPPKG